MQGDLRASLTSGRAERGSDRESCACREPHCRGDPLQEGRATDVVAGAARELATAALQCAIAAPRI
jgi:hypothetical protein